MTYRGGRAYPAAALVCAPASAQVAPMHVEIIELLRCPHDHETAALITVAHTRVADRLLNGELGCAVCGADYPLRHGVIYLSPAVARDARDGLVTAAVDAERTAALLALSDPDMRVMLCGAYATASSAIATMTSAHCVALNAPSLDGGADEGTTQTSWAFADDDTHVDHVVMRASGSARLPLADASLHALAMDTAHAGLLGDAARVVRVGGRVVAPAGVPVPEGLEELARDAMEWVAVVRATTTTPIGLRRASTTSDYLANNNSMG